MKDIASIKKMRRPSVAVSFGVGLEEGEGLIVTSTGVFEDFLRGGNR
jgi:hypothetical protein